MASKTVIWVTAQGKELKSGLRVTLEVCVRVRVCACVGESACLRNSCASRKFDN